jgi:hypothetical protein
MTGGRPAVTLVESATERGAGAGRPISRVCPNGPMSSRMVGGARDFRIRRTGPSACCTAIGHAVRIAAGDTILTDTPDSRKANPRLTGRWPGYWEPCPPVLHHMCPAQSARRLSNVSPIRTNDSVSRACPIGHTLDISFENCTSSLRIYTSCRVPDSVSYSEALTCGDARCLTACHLGFVSNSCHFFRTPPPVPGRHTQSLRARTSPFRMFRHVTAIADVARA